MSEENLESQQPNPQSEYNQSEQFPPANGGGTPNNNNYGIQQNLPNATIVLVLGILSIVTCCCYGIIGLILGIVALVLSKKDIAAYAVNANAYTESSYKNLKAGKVCAIIGLILNVLTILFYVAIIAFYGFAALNQDALREIIQNAR